jgi:ABC-type glycerol-3-phosphate transport system permease component
MMQTLPVALSTLQGQFSTQWDVLMAGSVILHGAISFDVMVVR